MQTAPLAALTEVAAVLLPACEHKVADALVYSNLADLDPAFAQHLRRDVYAERVCAIAAVALRRFDPGALLLGGDEFLVRARGHLVAEQVAPYLRAEPGRLAALGEELRPVLHIREECLLAARWGLYTWGHWTGELLPAIVAAEALHPGRFRFLLPGTVTADPDPALPTVQMRESLLAYGIGPERLLPLHPAMTYRFDRLFAVGPIWSDHMIHPDAASLIRDRLRLGEAASPTRLVALERLGPGRMIANADAVRRRLEAAGFTFHTPGRMTFLEQVELFRSARTIFAVLGSDLSLLPLAPRGVRLVSAAPSVFGDRFFYAMVQERQGFYADLRGPITRRDAIDAHRSCFHLDPAEIDAALLMLAPPWESLSHV